MRQKPNEPNLYMLTYFIHEMTHLFFLKKKEHIIKDKKDVEHAKRVLLHLRIRIRICDVYIYFLRHIFLTLKNIFRI